MIKIVLAQLVNSGPLPKTPANQDTLNTILTTIFVVIGALAILIIVVAGFRLVISQGQPEKVAEARKQIIYAFVGLVLAAMAATLVNFVIGRAG